MLFVAVRGATVDGHDYVAQAVEFGSPAVCVEHPMDLDVDQIVVEDSRKALGLLAAEAHGHPSRSVDVVGVTGTNGKTTVTHYLASLASSAGRVAGLIGTIEARVGDRRVEAAHTTPEASDFQRLLAGMRDDGADLVAAEVSSHALELGRIEATEFRVAAFTNISQDHLDFHGNMERYRSAKRKLFTDYPVATAVVNVDDPLGNEIASGFGGDLISVGEKGDVRFTSIEPDRSGAAFDLATPWGSSRVKAPVVGVFNVSNAVVAATCAMVEGISFDDVIRGLGELAEVPGRFELVSGDDPIRVVVDYAHTPEGVSAAIAAARSTAAGRVIALIGAGGDRDRDKRSLMGAAVAEADLAVVTSDNPRSEEPSEIVSAVLSGVPLRAPVVSEVDRWNAIELAINSAEDGDVVLVLGRGHEPYQEVAGERVPFDDRVVAREALSVRRSAGSASGSGSMSQ